MVFDEDEYQTIEKRNKVLEQEIKDSEESLTYNNACSLIDDITRNCVISCQTINLCQNSENLINKDEKIIDEKMNLSRGEMILDDCLKDSKRRKHHLKLIRYIENSIDRIMEAKHVWQV